MRLERTGLERRRRMSRWSGLGLALLLPLVLTACGPADELGELGETAQALTVTKRYLYVIDNAATNRVVAYLRSATTGKLTLIGAYGTTGTGSRSFILSQGGLGIDATQRFLYACNPGSNDISVMEIDPKTGALSYRSKVPSGGTMPVSLAVQGSPGSGLVVVANSPLTGAGSTYVSFRMNADGSLKRLCGTSGLPACRKANPVTTQVLFSNDGKLMVGVTGAHTTSGAVTVYSVSTATGVLTPTAVHADPTRSPYGGQFRPGTAAGVNHLIMSDVGPDLGNEGADAYIVTATSIAAYPKVITGEQDACWAVARADGAAWVINTSAGSITLMNFDAAGRLRLPAGSDGTEPEGAFDNLPSEAALSPDGGYLYVINNKRVGASIQMFRTGDTTTDNGLTNLGSQSVPLSGSASNRPFGMVAVDK